MSRTSLRVQDRDVPVSHLDRVLYPAVGFRKIDVIRYYIEIAPVFLPQIAGRPLSFNRFPDGVDKPSFYQKRAPRGRPDWIRVVPVARKSGEPIPYCVIDSLPALVWSANQSNLELHAFQHLARKPDRATSVIFDLDPGPPADVVDACRVALWIRDILVGVGLEAFVKTSGSKGMQIVVPLKPVCAYERTKAFAHTIANALEERFAKLVTATMTKQLRSGRVFIDWSQNDDKKTTIAPYSLRGREEPTVSTPVTWDEVARAVKKKSVLRFTAEDVIQRVKTMGDLFAPISSLRQSLPRSISGKLG